MRQPVKIANSSEQMIRQRHMQRLKKRRQQIMRRRFFVVVILVAAVVLTIMYLTPIFNIRSVDIRGNNRIAIEDLTTYLSDVTGENIFKINNRYIKNKLKQITYIDSVEVTKKYIPAKITINLKEFEPMGYFENGDKYDVIDKLCRVLESRSDKPTDMPSMEFYSGGGADAIKDEGVVSALTEFFGIAGRIDIISGITNISVLEQNEINFDYENRLNVICGSSIELEQKLRLFKVTVNNPNLSENAHGSLDLRTPGNAMYTP